MSGTLFWTFEERHNWSFYIQSTTNIQQSILHPSADSSNLKRKFHALISALIFDATPFLSSRKQDSGSGSIIQSLFLPSILCRHHVVRLKPSATTYSKQNHPQPLTDILSLNHPQPLKPSPKTYRHFIIHIHQKNALFLAPTDAYEIQLLIKIFLKIASCIVSEWLSKLFNKCMTAGEFPDSCKIAHITPIPKVHSSSSSSEYRPISVLPVMSKLFEKILYHRVYSYLTQHNLIDKRQYGFRKNQSTELAFTSIYDELLSNFDNKLITCSLFLDLSKLKAFDCCDHEI